MIRVLALGLLIAWTGSVSAQERTLSVQGVGQIAAAPDMATVTLGAQTEAESAQAALRASSEAVAATLGVLGEAGIAARDIQTSGLSLSPRWTRPAGQPETPPKIAGYVASNTLTVRVRDLEALGEVLDAVVAGGANQLQGVTFGLAEPRPVEDAARRAAIEDARSKAELFAGAAGVALGDVLSISEAGGGGGRPMMRMEAVMADAAVPVAPGELTVSARVGIVFALSD